MRRARRDEKKSPQRKELRKTFMNFIKIKNIMIFSEGQTGTLFNKHYHFRLNSMKIAALQG